MKTIITYSILMVLFLLNDVVAQDCTSFMPLTEGYVWEVTNYNKKGKEEGVTVNTIESSSVDGEEVTATVNMVTKSGKDEYSTSYTMTCSPETFKMSMNLFLPDEQMKQMESMESMEVELDMEDMEFPNKLEVGMDLKDATMTMVAKANGIQVMSTETTIKDRKVVSMVTITTPAGTFECYKIEQTSAMKMSFMNKEFKSISYVAEGVGVVRSESLDKKGEIASYSEITRIN